VMRGALIMGYWMRGGLELRTSWRLACVSAMELSSEVVWFLPSMVTTGLDSSIDLPLTRMLRGAEELGVSLSAGDDWATVTEVAYLPVGGLDASGFLAPARSANERLSNVSDLLRFREEVDEDREWETKSGTLGRTVGDDVPSLTTFGLDDESVDWNWSVLEVRASRTTLGLDELFSVERILSISSNGSRTGLVISL
jgi:hypothetical protein